MPYQWFEKLWLLKVQKNQGRQYHIVREVQPLKFYFIKLDYYIVLLLMLLIIFCLQVAPSESHRQATLGLHSSCVLLESGTA